MSLHGTAAFMVAYALQSGLVLVVGVLAPRLLRLRHPRTLLIYWHWLLAAVVLLPLAAPFWQPVGALPVIHLDTAVVEEVVATALPSRSTSFSPVLPAAAIAAIAALGLARIAMGFAYLRRCRRDGRPVRPLPRHLAGLQRRLGLRVPFVISNRLSAPITFGWARPIVMVPPSFAGLSADEQEGVACHELLHVRRRDWPVTVIEEVVRAVLWFHPAVWVLLARAALSREQIVDEGTVRITGKRRPYLDALWQIVCSARAEAAVLAVPLLGRSQLRARVEHLQKEIVMSRTRIVVSAVILSAAVAGAGYVGASAVFQDRAAETASLSPVSPRGTTADSTQSDTNADSGEHAKLKTKDASVQCDEITHPVLRETVKPVYPEGAREEKVQGLVIVELVVTVDGSVEDVRVLESPDERLSAAAVEAVRQWRYAPALCDGTPVSVFYKVTVNFQLH
jgi:TonB family protein